MNWFNLLLYSDSFHKIRTKLSLSHSRVSKIFLEKSRTAYNRKKNLKMSNHKSFDFAYVFIKKIKGINCLYYNIELLKYFIYFLFNMLSQTHLRFLTHILFCY